MKYILIMIVIFASVYAQDMQKYLKETQELIQKGEYEPAHQRLIWFHHHALKYDEGMYGVRLSYALTCWRDLGNIYPPAKVSLVETRDKKEKIIQDTTNSLIMLHEVSTSQHTIQEVNRIKFELFHDVTAINKIIEEQKRTVLLFEEIDKNQPELAKRCWNVAKNFVVMEKRYDIVKKYVKNLQDEFIQTKKRYMENISRYSRIGENFKTYNENTFVRESLQLIEIALAWNDVETAKDIQHQAYKIFEDVRLQEVFLSPGKK